MRQQMKERDLKWLRSMNEMSERGRSVKKKEYHGRIVGE